MSDMEKVFHISSTFAESEEWDIRQHRALAPSERLSAVEFLREQCCIAVGLREMPRIQKTGRILEARASQKDFVS